MPHPTTWNADSQDLGGVRLWPNEDEANHCISWWRRSALLQGIRKGKFNWEGFSLVEKYCLPETSDRCYWWCSDQRGRPFDCCLAIQHKLMGSRWLNNYNTRKKEKERKTTTWFWSLLAGKTKQNKRPRPVQGGSNSALSEACVSWYADVLVSQCRVSRLPDIPFGGNFPRGVILWRGSTLFPAIQGWENRAHSGSQVVTVIQPPSPIGPLHTWLAIFTPWHTQEWKQFTLSSFWARGDAKRCLSDETFHQYS